ncbi:pilus assembly PilX N-terminal domain-containing protein [bacterium]|nr:pilus assembly PilX N-terminal domain-containing protein [bacterium]
MRNRAGTLGNEQGFALLLALFVVASVMVLGMSIMTVSMMSSEASRQVSVSQQNFQVADGGADTACQWILMSSNPALPLELDPSVTNGGAPWGQFTAFSSDMNPINPATEDHYPYPEYRFMVTKAVNANFKDFQGQSLVIGKDETVFPTWHFYNVIAQSRSDQSAASDVVDRTVRLLSQRLFYEY